MNIEFQGELLKFLIQSKEGKKYRESLDHTLWDVPENQVLFQLWESYLKEFNTQPSKANMLEWWRRSAEDGKQQVDQQVFKQVERVIRGVYEPFTSDTPLIRKSIIEFAKKKATKTLFKENAEKIKTADDQFFVKLEREMLRIVKLDDEELDGAKNRGGFVLGDHSDTHDNSYIEGQPTYLRALNKMTAANGFHSPMLVVFMGAPKSFKTGVLLKICLEYVRDGLKVYYADTENGLRSIKARFKQGMLECERKELKGLQKELNALVRRFKGMGGDMNMGFYPANSKTLDDVDAELQYLKDEFGWVPDLIAYDYLDLFKSTNPKSQDKRLVIQDVYHHAVRLNNKWDTFALTISPVNKAAVNKAVINMKDFGEDFGKAYNCHAAFAICQTEEEQIENVARIVPVAQREGVQFKGVNVCAIKIDHAKMQVDEISLEAETRRIKVDKNLKDE